MKRYPESVDGLEVFHDGAILRVRLNRISRKNSLTDDMVYALADLFDAVNTDESVRTVHLCALGDDFCSGFDLGERSNAGRKPRISSIQRRMTGHVNRLISSMLTTSTPIVCSVQGWAVGLGLNLVLASDFAVVAENAKLWAPFVGFGFTPDSGASWMIPRLVGLARARRMLLLGEQISGAEAAAWGLVHESTVVTSLDLRSEALLSQLVKAPTVAVGATKTLMYRAVQSDLTSQLELEGWAMEVSSRSEDFKERIIASQENRDPRYSGR